MEACIQAHFTRMKLSRRGVVKAVVRYEFSILLCTFNTERFCRPTGFHGESGLAKSSGHIVVDFHCLKNWHVVTHHIYPTNEAYRQRGRSVFGKL